MCCVQMYLEQDDKVYMQYHCTMSIFYIERKELDRKSYSLRKKLPCSLLVWQQICQICHMPDGTRVSGLRLRW